MGNTSWSMHVLPESSELNALPWPIEFGHGSIHQSLPLVCRGCGHNYVSHNVTKNWGAKVLYRPLHLVCMITEWQPITVAEGCPCEVDGTRDQLLAMFFDRPR